MDAAQELRIVEIPVDRRDLTVLHAEQVRYSGPTPLLPVQPLRDAIRRLGRETRLVAVVATSEARLGGLLDMIASRGVEGVASGEPVTEAIKSVEDGRVAGTVDRESLMVVTGPEVVTRAALEGALARTTTAEWVSVTALVAAHGGRVAVIASDR